MSFPSIIFKSTNIQVRDALFDLVEKKLAVLDKFIGDETDVKCEVEFEGLTQQTTGDIYRLEVNFWLAGNLYRTEAVRDNFENAIDEVQAELTRMLERGIGKKQTLERKIERQAKEEMLSGE